MSPKRPRAARRPGGAKSAKPKVGRRREQPRRTALITGITGQDGSYLAEFLLAKGYDVIGVVRRTSHDSYERIGHLLDRLHIVPADLLDQHSLTSVIRDARPQEVYNLAAQSFVPTSSMLRFKRSFNAPAAAPPFPVVVAAIIGTFPKSTKNRKCSCASAAA